MRGLFSEGVYDVMLEHGILVDAVVGVSAGVLFGCNYKSGQIGRGLRYNTRFANDPRYMGWKSWWKTGSYLNDEFAYHTMPLELDKFDFEAFDSNPIEFHIACTDIVNGKAVYKKYVKSDDKILDWLRASGSMPLMANPVEVDGYTMLDGGIIDSIPLKYAQEAGIEKNIVILTQPKGYRKKPFSAVWLFKWFLKKYPKVAEMMAVRHEMYNGEIDYVYSEGEKDNTLLIYPDAPLDVSRVERDVNKLRECYEMGRRKGLAIIDEIKNFVGR